MSDFDQSRPAQGHDDLFKILEADVLGLCNVFEGGVVLLRLSGQFYHHAQSVAAFGKEFHGVTPAGVSF